MTRINFDALRCARENQALSREQVAVAAGCTAQTVERAETGKHSPELLTALLICRALGLDPARLLSDADAD